MSKFLVAVTGGIAAYKTCELVRLLIKNGHQVRVAMTASATKFVSALTFESLTSQAVITDLFADGSFGNAHIEAARWCDAFIVAPASANSLAKFANGIADDFVSTTYLACDKPLLLAPAMNTVMWKHPAVQKNLAELKTRSGHTIADPEEGLLACGEIGQGKMVDPWVLLHTAEKIATPLSKIGGKKILVTAGPTHEYLDPVRFISSPSSGKMGLAIAIEAWKRGAQVTLVHGPMNALSLPGLNLQGVTSASEMLAVCQQQDFDVFISAAAVSDYMPKNSSEEKMKKKMTELTLNFQPAPDVLKTLSASRKPHQKFVGFAAETHNILENAHKKLEGKNLDLIVLNEVYKNTKGFAQDTMTVSLLHRHGSEKKYAHQSKADIAKILLDEIDHLL